MDGLAVAKALNNALSVFEAGRRTPRSGFLPTADVALALKIRSGELPGSGSPMAQEAYARAGRLLAEDAGQDISAIVEN